MSVNITRDLRGEFDGVRDQGTRPTCLAFAVSDAHATLLPAFRFLSVDYLYYHAVRRMPDQAPHKGITSDTAVEALVNDGQPLETDWPYQLKPPLTLSALAPPAGCHVFRGALSFVERSFDEIRKVLDNGIPVVLCFRISESFYLPNIEGIIEVKNPDPETGRHAVIAVGHGTTDKESCVLVRNSWGATWGIGGHAFLERSYLEKRLILTSAIK
jgi:papain like protease